MTGSKPEHRRTVLIAHGDPEVRAVLARTLVSGEYRVLEARDGRLATAMLERQWPVAVICGFELEHVDGLKLLKQVRGTSATIPVIMILESTSIPHSKAAMDLGANDCFVCPIDSNEVLASLDVHVNSIKSNHLLEKDPEDFDLDFCRLSIDEFVAGKVSLADIFVRLSASKYIRVAKAGSDLSIDRIHAYKSRGLSFLYIRKADFAKYIGLNLELMKAVTRKNTVPKAKKVQLLKHTGEILIQDCYVNSIDKEKLQASAALVEALISTMSEDQELFELLEILQTHSDHLYAHSLGVSLYSVMIAKHLGWTSAPTLFKLATAGVLHDIGKKEISRELLEKPRHLLTRVEREIYETHPIRGKEVLSLVKSVPGDVLQIVMHHHENQVGRGFPYRLLKSKIHPLASLVAVANDFCNLVLKLPGSAKVDPHEALEKLFAQKGQELDLRFLRALMEMFSYPIPRGMPKIDPSEGSSV